MTKQYPSKQYLSEVISNREFAESVPPEIIIVMARQLLAGLEQEPVAYMYKDRLHTDARFSLHTRFGNWSQEDINEYEITEIPLYAAPHLPQPAVGNEFLPKNLDRALGVLGMALPESREEFNLQQERWIQRLIDRVIRCAEELAPQPAVPDEWRMMCGEWRDETVSIHDDSGLIVSGISPNAAGIIIEAHNTCRAAMLQGAEPVSQHPDLTVWYGSMPETNGKSNWTAILHRKGEGIQDGITIDRSEYPGRVLYAADRVRYLIGEKADRPYILDYDGDKHSGYFKPVSQSDKLRDGWVAVPVEPTREMRLQIHPIAEATCMECGRSVTADCEDNVLLSWADMIAAAPQQEAK